MRTIETMKGDMHLTGQHDDFGRPVRYQAKLSLEIISIARNQGCPALQVEDWSILRDAGPEHHKVNLAAALEWLRGARS